MAKAFHLDYCYEPHERAEERIARALAILAAAGQRARERAALERSLSIPEEANDADRHASQ